MNDTRFHPTGKAVLTVTPSGEFIWHEDADRLIEEGDYTYSPAMPHILRALRKNLSTEQATTDSGAAGPSYAPADWSGQGKPYADKALLSNDRMTIDPEMGYVSVGTSFDHKREWVELTHEELIEIYNEKDWDTTYGWDYEQAIEAKLKEKNT